MFSLTRVILARIIWCTRRRREPGQDQTADAQAVAEEAALELHADPADKGEKREIPNNGDSESAAGDNTKERELPPTPLENEKNEGPKETKPPELLDGLRALVDKAQMVSRAPLFPSCLVCIFFKG